jgi:hypothetical protein
MKTFSIALAVVALAGCGRELHVESDTEWSGAIGGVSSSSSVDGSGNDVFDIEPGDCWTFQKETRTGSLRAYATSKTIFGEDKTGEAVTSAEFGIVSGCEGRD